MEGEREMFKGRYYTENDTLVVVHKNEGEIEKYWGHELPQKGKVVEEVIKFQWDKQGNCISTSCKDKSISPGDKFNLTRSVNPQTYEAQCEVIGCAECKKEKDAKLKRDSTIKEEVSAVQVKYPTLTNLADIYKSIMCLRVDLIELFRDREVCIKDIYSIIGESCEVTETTETWIESINIGRLLKFASVIYRLGGLDGKSSKRP